jgi:DNA primase
VDIKSILGEIGYCNLRDLGNWYRCRPLYRESDSDTVLAINKQSGYWYDYKLCRGGKFAELIKLSLNLTSIEEAEETLNGKYQFVSVSAPVKETFKQIKIFDPNLPSKLIKDYSYWEKRGIPKSVIEEFNGGIAISGAFANRYVFPIYSERGQIIGFTGRALVQSNIKWKHVGPTKEWVYPVFFNKSGDYSKTIFIIESVGDMLALWRAGYKNTIITFGLNISSKIIKFILSRNPQKIILAFNNDSGNNNAGNTAAQNARIRLLSLFDEERVLVKLPDYKDFGEMSNEQIEAYMNKV